MKKIVHWIFCTSKRVIFVGRALRSNLENAPYPRNSTLGGIRKSQVVPIFTIYGAPQDSFLKAALWLNLGA